MLSLYLHIVLIFLYLLAQDSFFYVTIYLHSTFHSFSSFSFPPGLVFIFISPSLSLSCKPSSSSHKSKSFLNCFKIRHFHYFQCLLWFRVNYSKVHFVSKFRHTMLRKWKALYGRGGGKSQSLLESRISFECSSVDSDLRSSCRPRRLRLEDV